MIKKLKATIYLLVLLVVVAGIVLFWLLNRFNVAIVLSAPEVEAHQAKLNWNDSLNLEQSYNACGPHSTMAYIFLESGLFIDPEKIPIIQTLMKRRSSVV